MSIIQDYQVFYSKYNEKFGEKICLLVHNDKSYDLYKTNNFGNIDKIAEILKLEIYNKDKYMTSSFPSNSLSKAIPILLESFYIVIILKKNNSNILDISAIYFPENMNFGGFVF